MTTRDRIVLMAIVVLVVLAGGWVLVVSPERKQAGETESSVQSARSQLETAQTQAATARTAQRRYAAAYSSVVSLGKAVPPAQEVPSLIYELQLASDMRGVDFNSITTGGSGGSSSSSSSAAAAAPAPASFTPMPFTFQFNGSFAGLAHLLGEVQGFARRTPTGGLYVDGRLLTIQGVTITTETGEKADLGLQALNATITASAYVLPASQGLTGGATPAGPGSAGSGSASSGSSASTPPTTPAVVKAPTP
ncbi:MAG TPA: type II secretion system protein GspM [Solirubrobacteraceae bacterium]|jgi:hypothetical protein|nr:type II secretion system protein GspM [Solirubrobacteraceae bacterium]